MQLIETFETPASATYPKPKRVFLPHLGKEYDIWDILSKYDIDLEGHLSDIASGDLQRVERR